MWNRSDRWQRKTRIAAGAIVFVASLMVTFMIADAPAARRAWAGARDLWGEVVTPAQLTVQVVVPKTLGARPGALVYLDRDDGVAQIIGRVVAVEPTHPGHDILRLRIMMPTPGPGHHGGVLKGATASVDLREVVRLLVSPETPSDEAIFARDAIWPSVRQHVLPNMVDALIREISKELADLGKQDQALIAESLRKVRATLRPLEDELVNRLAERAKDAIGVGGVAKGLWRTTADGVRNSGVAVSDWWWGLFGLESAAEIVDRPFLSEKTRAVLAAAVEAETAAFWRDHRAKIVDALTRVAIERRHDFEVAFQDRWAGLLYDRAVVPAWREGQDEVVAAVQNYANDFAARRLLTKDGGPRLLFAHALRCSLAVSDSPLLIYAPGDTEEIRYVPLLP
jgi:hypothetical protein